MNAVGRLALATATAALLGGLASPALAADSVTVDASVSVVGPCLTTTTNVLDFGQLSLQSGSSQPIDYTNCSGTVEHVFARGTDAGGGGGGADWFLDDSGTPCPDLGLNRYRLQTFTGFLIGTTDREIDEVEAGSDGSANGLALFMPCAGSDGIGQTLTFQVIFTATF
jgi:hypothetical protein